MFPLTSVNCTNERSSSLYSHKDGSPAMFDQKMMRFPSGVHTGCLISLPGIRTNILCMLPSAFITQRLGSPVRRETNAIMLPSGDHAGESS
jgi:hypothetical protein